MKIKIENIDIEKAWELRQEVMYPNKDLEYVKLPEDEVGIHLGLFTRDLLVSVISLFINGKDAQFRKFSTLEPEQGKGYGSALLNYTFEQAANSGVKRIWCNARENKVTFYKKFGMKESNKSFHKGGITYIIMERTF